jgi:hypothetical protein
MTVWLSISQILSNVFFTGFAFRATVASGSSTFAVSASWLNDLAPLTRSTSKQKAGCSKAVRIFFLVFMCMFLIGNIFAT